MELSGFGQERVPSTGEMQLLWGSWNYAAVEQQVLDTEQFPKGGSQDREPCCETWSPSSTKLLR